MVSKSLFSGATHITKKQNILVFLITAGFFLFLDQLTKILIRENNIYNDAYIIKIIPTTNTGSLFSLFADVSYSNILFIILSFIAIFVLSFKGQHLGTSKYVSFIIGLLLAGILGNFFDRVLFGAVFDWISFMNWPIFNIADSCIVLGVSLATIHMFTSEKKSSATL